MKELRLFLATLRSKGARLYLENGKLKSQSSKGSINDEDRVYINKNKQLIIEYLDSLKTNITRSKVKVNSLETRQDSLLSFAQQRLWFIDSLQGGSPEYNMPMAFEVTGKLNLALITDIFNTILERHEVLRTVYVEESGETLQHICNMSDIAFDIKVEDISHLTGDTLDGQVKTLVEADITTPFDLAVDLMLRVSYVKKTANTGVMIFNMHHIASDGWSMEVLIKEFFTLYDAYRQGQANPLPPLDIQYADYAHWQREYLAGEVLESQLSYWEKQLDELPALHSLPLDYARPAMKQHKGAIVTGELSSTIAKQLLGVAKSHKLTPFMLLHGALSLVLSRHSNSVDIVIGTPVANRLQSELEPLIGFFVNTLVLRVDTNYESLSDYFAHIRQVHLDAQSNQDVPFEQLVERLKAPRSTAHSPLFQIMMTTNTDYGLNDASDVALFTLPDVDIQPYQSDIIQAKFDIEIDLSISEQGVGLHWTYDSSLFTDQHIAQLNDHLSRLLEGLSQTQRQPSKAPHDLPLLSTGEIQHLVHDLNDTAMDYPKDKCIHELFEQQAEDNPGNVAVVFEDKQLTYKQLNEKANQLAHYLKQHHEIKPDTLVGLCVERSLEMVIGILGILKAGGAYVPLDPSYPKERLSYMLEDAALDVVLSQTQVQTVLAGYNGAILTLDELAGTDNYFCSEYGNSNLTASETGLTSSNLAYVIYTSGSTGEPKGVLIEHSSVNNLVYSQKDTYQIGDSRNEVGLMLANYAFDAAVEQMFVMLLTSNTLIVPSTQALLESEKILKLIMLHQVTHIDSTPSHLMSFVDCLNYSSINRVISGGEAMLPQLCDVIGAHITLYNVYGPTEACVTSSVSLSGRSIGKPVGNTEFYLLNDSFTLAPKGSIGELFIGGNGLARGYLNRPALTAERFIDNPLYDESKPNSSARLYRTGDLVRYLPDGNLEFLGRADDQVKIRGFRIELGEVEAQLAQLEMVDSALVMAKELAGSEQLVGYVRPRDTVVEIELANYVAAVKAFLAQQLPEYMVPSVIMVIEDWPLTPNGKVDRKALPEPDGSALQGEYIAPETETEQALVHIWAELLNIEAEAISTTANFFELGGHSLLSIRLVSEIRIRCGVEVSVQSIFDNSSLQALAVMIEQGTQAVVRPPFLMIKRDSDKVPVSFAQQRLWFIDSLQGGSPEYNMPMAFEVVGQLDITLVSNVFNTILERHEVLRTVYFEESGETLQHICNMSDIAFDIKIEDISHLTGDTLDGQIKTLVEADITTPFDLAADLMLRVSYVKKSADTSVMIFNMHHIASDGWSMEVLTKEFFALYEAYSQGKTSPLPALDIQYADYAHWQREYLTGEVLESQLSYWEQQLDELPALHSLPLDHVRPTIKQHEGAIVTGELPAAIAKQLLNVAKEHKLTPFMLLHGALSLLLSRHSNSADIVIGTPVANRLQVELESLIGFFVNTLVLRVDTNHESLSDYFAHIRQVHLDAQSNQDVPFEQLVERLKASRSTAHSPLFQIMMTTNTDYGLNDASDIASFTFPDVDIQPYQSDLILAKFDIEIDLSISEQGVGLNWTYDVSLFTAQHITQLNEHLCRLLKGLSQAKGQPSKAPHDLPLLSIEEIQHLVYDLNETPMDYPKDKCIHELFEQQAEDNPDNVAVVFEDKQLTYKQLNEKANQLAHYLKEHHEIKPDTLVGLCVERSLEMVIGILGILKAGGAYVPLDPNYPQERLSYMLKDAALDVVLSQRQVRTVLQGYNGSIITLDGLSDTDNHFCSDYNKRNLSSTERGLTSSNLAYVIYTSGSTGKPKGVELEHRSVLNYLTNSRDYLTPEIEYSVMSTSLNFDATVTSLFGAWLEGGYLVLIDERNDIFESLSNIVTKKEAGLFKVTPSHLQGFVFDEPILTAHVVVVGGEEFSYDLAMKITQKMPNTHFINEYGPTESTVGCSYQRFNYNDIDAYSEQLSIDIGQPVTNTQFFILNEHRKLLPNGCIGELYIGGEGLARGYLNRPELTAERFIDNPFYDESKPNSSPRLYKTGDLVRYLLNENLEFIGRADDQVKILGFRIELGEVEAQLTQLNVVDSALLIARELAGSQQLVGYIKPAIELTEQSGGVFVQGVLDGLKKQLPKYMIPSIVMVVEEWPLTPNGKVDRKALPTPDGSTIQGEFIAPTTDTEQVLVDIWAELLNIAPESISTSANFFDLGGHSLLTVKLMSLIHTRLEKACELSVLFSETTIQSQGIMLDSLESGLQRKELLYKVNDCIAPTEGIILIPGVASTAKDFMEIVKHLQQSSIDDVEIGIFRHKGLIAGEQYFKTIEENVTAFAESLASMPFKQITLVGHSYGGVLALELANHLKNNGYEVELVMLDTYFEQQRLGYSKNNQSTSLVDFNALDIPSYLQDLYQHQSNLFNTYEPLMGGVLPTTVVFANQSPFTQRQYMGYLEDKFLGQKMDYTSVDGDHLSMLKGRSAELISKIINNKGNHNVA